MDVHAALAEQHAELDAILSALDDDAWATPVPRCPGWTVADVVLHMAQTDEVAAASARGDFEGLGKLFGASGTVDDGAADAVEVERGAAPSELLARWRAAASAQRELLAAADPKVRLPWVTNTLTPKALATTRLSECWIHTGDIADALGVPTPPTDRLQHIAWLAWRTVPYAFERDGQKVSGPVAVALIAPDGSEWRFGDFDAASTTVTGPAEQWCEVAARRLEPADTELRADGPDADEVLRLVRTYA
jgi:uncharacterized protein (TIGR03084 family)